MESKNDCCQYCDFCGLNEVYPKFDEKGKIVNPPICEECLKKDDDEELRKLLKQINLK